MSEAGTAHISQIIDTGASVIQHLPYGKVSGGIMVHGMPDEGQVELLKCQDCVICLNCLYCSNCPKSNYFKSKNCFNSLRCIKCLKCLQMSYMS